MLQNNIKILFIGDVFGITGVEALTTHLKSIIDKHQIDFTIVNGENSANGRGISRDTYQRIMASGADCITLGNHFLSHLEHDYSNFFDNIATAIVRPLNISKEAPGVGSRDFKVGNKFIRVTNLLGRFLQYDLLPSSPFDALDKLIDKTVIHIIDFHAESTAEKIALAEYYDGVVTAVIGTHTHVQSADERILDKSTAFLTDAGMSGGYKSIIGMKVENAIVKSRTSLPSKFVVASGDVQIAGCIITVDKISNKAVDIKRILFNKDHNDYETR